MEYYTLQLRVCLQVFFIGEPGTCSMKEGGILLFETFLHYHAANVEPVTQGHLNYSDIRAVY